MYSNFNCDVNRNDDRTVITVSKCRYITALFLLGKFKKKFGHWTSGSELKLWGQDQLTNSGCNIQVTIPHSKNPKHSKNPFTKEYVGGYIAGLNEFLKDAKTEDIMRVVEKEAGIT